MATPNQDQPLSSPLVSAFNNIVNIKRSATQMQRTKSSYDDFIRFMNVEVKNLEAIKLPDEKEIKKVQTLNVTPTFGSAGSLLSSLVSGALDLGGLVGNFFGGKKKNPSPKTKPIPKGKKLRIPGLRGLPLVSAALAGLDFAQGLGEGESVGKAGAGALGSAAGAAGGAIAGTALAGAIGQALVPVPGLGFVLGAAVGSLGGFAGGWLADRAYESVTGEGKVKGKQEQKLAQAEAAQKAKARVSSKLTFPEVLDKFDSVVSKFEEAAFLGTFGTAQSIPGVGADGEFDVYHEEIPERTPSKAPDNIIDSSYTAEGGEKPSKYVNTIDYNEYRSYYNNGKGGHHAGEDLPINQGTPVSIIVPGTVVRAAFTDSAAGGEILITHEDGKQTRYLHMSQINVSPGQKLESGQVIGATGGTPGTKGAGRSTGAHLHFEYYPSTSAGMADPNPVMDNYFRFGGNVKVKKAATTPAAVQPGGTAPTAVLMAGTNDYGSPAAGAAGVRQAIKNLQQKGFKVVVVPPSEVGGTAAVSKEVQKVAQEMGATVRKGQYMQHDNSGAIPYAHLTQNSADAIAKEYKGATFVGDSNAQKIPGAAIAKPGMSASGIAEEINKQIRTIAKAQPVQRQVAAPEQLQQYPSYNTPQNTVTVVPIVAGGSGSGDSNQRPVVVSSGNGGQTTIIHASERRVLNSVYSTSLLTNLSGT